MGIWRFARRFARMFARMFARIGAEFPTSQSSEEHPDLQPRMVWRH